MAAILGVPGLAAAEPAAELGLSHVWDLLVRIFQADQPPSTNNSGEGTNGGGAMDPNGGPPTGGVKPGNP